MRLVLFVTPESKDSFRASEYVNHCVEKQYINKPLPREKWYLPLKFEKVEQWRLSVELKVGGGLYGVYPDKKSAVEAFSDICKQLI